MLVFQPDGTMADANPHRGSTFEEFLRKEGLEEEVNAVAIKHVLAWQIDR